MGELRDTFRELIFEGELMSESYPFYAVLQYGPEQDDALKKGFIDELCDGLAEVDYSFRHDCAGKLRFCFRSAEDRDALYSVRESDVFDYNVRKRMENVFSSPKAG